MPPDDEARRKRRSSSQEALVGAENPIIRVASHHLRISLFFFQPYKKKKLVEQYTPEYTGPVQQRSPHKGKTKESRSVAHTRGDVNKAPHPVRPFGVRHQVGATRRDNAPAVRCCRQNS